MSRACGEMGIDHEVAGAWEIDAQIGDFLKKLFTRRSDRCNINIGSTHGDMAQVRAEDVPNAEGLIAGPPCPPWSLAGKRQGWNDERAKPSKVLFSWLQHLCRRQQPLRFFILENVRGILGKNGAGWVGKLRAALPRGWVLAVLRMDSRCLAQTRPRVYLVGWKCKMSYSSSQATAAITAKLPRLSQRRLSDIVLGLPNEDPKKMLSAQQARNFRKWMRHLKSSLNDKRKKGMIGCFEVDRNPNKSRATSRTDDLIMTLRASGNPIWLVSLGEGRCAPSISRLLTVEERCLLQGFNPSTIPQSASPRKVRQVMGNAMTVPVIGSVVGAILLQLQEEDSAGRQDPSEGGKSSSDVGSSAGEDDVGSSESSSDHEDDEEDQTHASSDDEDEEDQGEDCSSSDTSSNDS